MCTLRLRIVEGQPLIWKGFNQLNIRVCSSIVFGGERWKTNVLLTCFLFPGYVILLITALENDAYRILSIMVDSTLN